MKEHTRNNKKELENCIKRKKRNKKTHTETGKNNKIKWKRNKIKCNEMKKKEENKIIESFN